MQIEDIKAIGDENSYFAYFLRFIVTGIVDFPDEVRVVPRQGEQTLLLEVHVNQKDIGKVIGKQGSMAKSLRTIIASISTKHQRRVVMEIQE
jgi:predicted RNA-binding protein YlqC (UPF0109 family)